jgi:hypothetical protein
VPLDLFRSRNFSVTNVSTMAIYGALYVSGYTQAIFTQGTLGYSAVAAGFIGTPSALLLIFLSQRFGALAAHTPRRFMTAGPIVMALGILWLMRIPNSSTPWNLQPGDPSTWIPPASYFVDFLPASLLFGLGLAMTVAPLTTTLMASVPVARAGLGSAINNALSRVGPQLAGAVVFVAITGAFYADLSNRVPTLDTSSDQVRAQVAPLNKPDPGVPASVVDAAHQSSTDSFHLAMGIVAFLLLTGAVVNGIGIRDPKRQTEEAAADHTATEGGQLAA